MAEINWELSASEISNLIRGLSPTPGAYSFYKGKRIKILRAEQTVPAAHPGEAGTVLTADKHQGLVVACGEGALGILEIQPSGKGEMKGIQFVNGYRLSPGDKFLSS